MKGIERHDYRIALVQPPVWGVHDPPAGLAQISSCLKQAGYEVGVFDLNIELYSARSDAYRNAWAIEQSSFWTDEVNVDNFFRDNAGEIAARVRAVADSRPALVAFSINVCSWAATRLLSRELKKLLPAVRIVAGGPSFCVPADVGAILREGAIDFVVRGEGEETLLELSECLRTGADTAAVRGICFERAGGLASTTDRAPIRDLDALPFLDISSFPRDKYDPPGHLGNHIALQTSRGCVQNCVFCGPRAYWPGYRTMSGRRIHEEICEHLGRFPETERIEFLDLLLNGDMRVLRELCGLLAGSSPPKRTRWHANLIIRPEMDEAMMRLMRDAGCEHVTYGIESGSQRVLDIMRKRYRVHDADDVLRATHKAGIKVSCNFMFGFPGETEEDFGCTLDFLKRNAACIDVAYPSRTYCTLEPHSYLAKHPGEFGVVSSHAHGQYWRSEDGANTFIIRMNRCEEFSRLAQSLGLHVGSGLQTSVAQDRWLSLGHYYESIQELQMALECLERYLECDAHNVTVAKKVAQLRSSRAAQAGRTGAI
jgi:radical SAM superfamily enzyme YgiQ (UPF0313 family)